MNPAIVLIVPFVPQYRSLYCFIVLCVYYFSQIFYDMKELNL
jgi:hypothetical protein